MQILKGAELARNYASNPRPLVDGSAWAYQSGTDEVNTLTVETGAGPNGLAGFKRAAISTAKTAGNSGHYVNETAATGVTGDKVTGSLWVRSSAAVTVSLGVTCRVGTGSTAAGTASSGNVDLVPNVWTRLSATATATADFGNVQVWARLGPTAIVPAGGTFDAAQMMIEKSAVLADYYDGNLAASADHVFEWAGTAGSSVSIKYARVQNLVVEALADGPWAGVTVQGLEAGVQVLTVWRTAGGERLPVRGGRKLEALDSAYLIDYEVPLAQPVSYEVEVVSGSDAGAVVAPAVVTVASSCGYVHDPLDPTVAVPVWAARAPNGEPVLGGTAFKALTLEAEVSYHNIVGSSLPVAIGGARQAASAVDLSMLTDAEAQNTRLRDMLKNTSLLVVRGLPGWLADAWPPVAYVSAPVVVEQPLAAHLGPGVGRYITRWTMEGRRVRGSSASVLISLFTYDDVAALFETYDQKQAAAGGGTYLDDLKNPLNA